jgi:transposase-like protein
LWRHCGTSHITQNKFKTPHSPAKLRTTNVIERCFVEVRRRTRPMVCFVNVESVDRIIYAIFNGYNEQHEWRNRTLRLFTQAA